jgi:hypothetical protein
MTAANRTMMDAYFFAVPADDWESKESKRRYRTAEKIFESHGGEWFAEDVCMGEQALCYSVPNDRLMACGMALKKAGFRLNPTPGYGRVAASSKNLL